MLSQGSVFKVQVWGPLLFNLYMKDIINTVLYNCKIIQFADDIAILQDKSIERIYSCLSKTFNKINNWLSATDLELSIPKTQFIIFHRTKNKIFSDNLEVSGGKIQRLNYVKYLDLLLDNGLRWIDHLRVLKIKTSKYLNILKWLTGKTWGIDPLQAISFINATIVAQLLWEATWYINASKNNIKQIESIIASSYKIALGLPRNSFNKVCWSFLNQPFKTRIAQYCDKNLCKLFKLCKGRIINNIKFIFDQIISGKVAIRNVPYIISR